MDMTILPSPDSVGGEWVSRYIQRVGDVHLNLQSREAYWQD